LLIAISPRWCIWLKSRKLTETAFSKQLLFCFPLFSCQSSKRNMPHFVVHTAISLRNMPRFVVHTAISLVEIGVHRGHPQ
jgi:hypothetical protein